jgi:hypothetical protein
MDREATLLVQAPGATVCSCTEREEEGRRILERLTCGSRQDLKFLIKIRFIERFRQNKEMIYLMTTF